MTVASLGASTSCHAHTAQHRVRSATAAFVWLVLILFADPAFSQTPQIVQPPGYLKKLSLDELQAIEVTSVSKRPEKLSGAPSSVQVITGDDIRRAGATSLPEALRLASNLQVAQVDSHGWAITARGFNNTSANKLLVLVDGRAVYTPLHAGVFWDVQDTLLEDIDRIEVISGPGATLWGGNAVNNDYGHIRSLEQLAPPAPFPLVFLNGQTGDSYGAELTAECKVTDWWRLRSGYTALRLHIRPEPGSTDTS